jgi:hypothetical protein
MPARVTWSVLRPAQWKSRFGCRNWILFVRRGNFKVSLLADHLQITTFIAFMSMGITQSSRTRRQAGGIESPFWGYCLNRVSLPHHSPPHSLADRATRSIPQRVHTQFPTDSYTKADRFIHKGRPIHTQRPTDSYTKADRFTHKGRPIHTQRPTDSHTNTLPRNMSVATDVLSQIFVIVTV